jgi:hypothetical protein
MIDALYYSSRISAVRVRKLGIALTLFNLIILFSRFANTIQAPLTGSIVDNAMYGFTHQMPTANLTALAWQFRYIIFAATIGSIIGAALVPSFVQVFTRVLKVFEREASIYKMFFKHVFQARTYRVLIESARKPTFRRPEEHKKSTIPHGFLIANVIVVAIYTTGVLSTIYSGALIPDHRLTADNLSGIVNVIATFLLITLVDPSIALITDQAIARERPEHDVKVMVWYLVVGKIIGTLLAQLFFMPASGFIASVAQIIAKPASLANLASFARFFPRWF